MELLSLWQEIKPEEGRPLLWQVGHLRIWLMRQGNDWQVAHLLAEQDACASACAPQDELPKDVDWKHWPFATQALRFCMRPVLPDRALVLRPANALELPPGQSIELYAGLPVWVKLEIESAGKWHALLTVPSRELPQTWFGAPDNGELAYAVRTPARRRVSHLGCDAATVVAPVGIYNDAMVPLSLERICLRPDALHIYAGKAAYLWASPLRVTFRGKEHTSSLDYLDKPPAQDADAVRLHKADRSSDAAMLRRTFHYIVHRPFV